MASPNSSAENERQDRDFEVFTEALELSPSARTAFLERSCGSDSELKQRVELLLKTHEEAGDFLEYPAQEPLIQTDVPAVLGEKAGDTIGRFKLLQQIGEGGCGVVFMAGQEEPIRRKVALKIIKPGMDSKSVIARFEAERQALALMDHPGIAKLFEAGATASGRPYFVMELVRGVKITEYCDQRSLTIENRLKLFVQVCQAVQHAHQKGIIHRDIKPGNILVTHSPEGLALPVIIDFGIAKATTNQRLTDKTLFTAFEMLVGTPAYMSPEQAELSSVDVDTRTDIYSLGVLLYELLTGSTPFATNELLKAGIDEIRRAIREKEPAKPSTRLSTMMAGEQANFSQLRGEGLPKLIRKIRGDLDWIVMQALEKDRSRRYATASELSMDVERHLAGEAVSACPPSAAYKARRFIVRNKLACASLAVIFLLLSVGFGVTVRLLAVETQKREQAERLNEIYDLEEKGISLLTKNKMAEAEKSFRRSMDLRNQFLGGAPPNPAIVVFYLMALERENKFAEANTLLLTEIAHSQPGLVPYYTKLLFNFGTDLAMKGHWREAAHALTGAIKFMPPRSDDYHTLAPVLVAAGDISEYRELCQQEILHFRDTQNPNVADQMAKDCLILAQSGADMKAVGALANVAVLRGTNNASLPLFECCQALAEYRSGRFGEAIKWASAASTNDFRYAKAESLAVLSMAQLRSGQTNEARKSLADCSQVIETKFPKLSSGNLGNDWRDWIMSQALRVEAKQLIEQSSTLEQPFVVDTPGNSNQPTPKF